MMLFIALTGLVALFSAIQGQRTPRTESTRQHAEAPTAVTSRSNVHVADSEEGGIQSEKKASPGKKRAGNTNKPNMFFILIDDMGWNDIGYQSSDLRGVTPNLDKLAAGGVKMTDYYSHTICTPARASLMTGRYAARFGMQYSIVETGAPWGLPVSEKIFPQYMKDAGYDTHMVGKWHLGSFDKSYIPSERGFDSYLGYLEGQGMYWTHQVIDAEEYGHKFFDFGFGNATGYYDIVDRPLLDGPVDESMFEGDNDEEIMLSPTSTTKSMSGSVMFKGEYSTRVFQDRAVEILKEKTPFDEEPLYMYLAHQAVHRPLGLPPEGSFSEDELALLNEIEDKSDDSGHTRKRFAEVLMYLDHTIGELVEYLETEGWMENSIIVVASDNGGCPKNGGSNYPLRGTKTMYWEGGSKVPAFVYSTSHIPEERWGTEYDGMMHVTDWLPTLASAAGITLDGGAGPLDGVDHWDYITSAATAANTDTPRQEMLYNFDPYMLGANEDGSINDPNFELAQGAFRSGKWKYMANEWCSGWYTFNLQTQAADPRTTDDATVCDGSACSTCEFCTGYPYWDYLFDLEADPREENNLVDVYPEIAQSLRDRWMETAMSEFGHSGFETVDYRSYEVSDVHVADSEEGAGERQGIKTDKESPEQSKKSTGNTNKPNMFFILIDDMGWNDIGYQSLDLQGVTPNLDKLAAGGVKMTDYYSHMVCTPARASLMTGRYVVRFGMQYNIVETGAPWGLPLTEKLFPQYMKDAGYETHMVGKWHLGSFDNSYIPSERGFDSYMGYLEGQELYWTHQVFDAEKYGHKFFDFGFGNATGYYDIIDRPLLDYPVDESIFDGQNDEEIMLSPTSTSKSMSGSVRFEGEYSTRVFQDRAMEILKEKTPFDEEPLYMYLAHQAVHRPLGLPPEGSFSEDELALLNEIEDKSDDSGHIRKRFAEVLMYLDHTIGELVEYLETEGWMENSIIVVASDNGGCANNGGSNYPLRGTKVTYWEGGSKVPAFLYSTSHIAEERWGTEYDGMMHVTDWLPTLASAAGITLDGGAGPLDGVDHWDYIASAAAVAKTDTPRQEMLYNFDPYVLGANDDGSTNDPDLGLVQGAFRSGKWKYVANEWCYGWYTFDLQTQAADPLTTDDATVCDGSACSTCGYCTGYPYSDYLFDLEADPREENNLLDVYPEVAQSLRDRWLETAMSEFGHSGFETVDYRSYDVWLKYNWWVVPWWDQVEKPPVERRELL
eukprot:g9384.t1